jgi:hypothetical protein
MKRSALGSLPVFALVVLGACASIETQQVSQEVFPQVSPQASPLPEPPPWNSLEMMWMETEIVRLSPSASPISS